MKIQSTKKVVNMELKRKRSRERPRSRWEQRKGRTWEETEEQQLCKHRDILKRLSYETTHLKWGSLGNKKIWPTAYQNRHCVSVHKSMFLL